MTCDLAIYNELAGTSAVTALVGDRIYPVQAAEGVASPYIVYTLISEVVNHALNADGSEVSALYQVSSFDPNQATAKAVSAAVRTALSNFMGTLGGVGGVTVNRILFEQESYGGLDPQGRVHQMILEFDIFYTRA